MICTGCNQDKDVVARGLCAACYNQWRKRGTTERTRMKRGEACSIEGCEKKVHGRGMCHMHLKRERLTGTTADPRADQPLPVTLHPLYPQWVDFQRARNPRPVVPEWKASFEAFLEGVGTRPSNRHRLYRVDKTAAMGPGNFEWRLALVEKLPGEASNEYNKRYRRAHKDIYTTDYHTASYMRKFGITFHDFQRMLKEQDGKCALCGEPETALRHGRVQALSVDHDHTSNGKESVRALLCGACNKGLGLFKDDTDLLLKAIAYLATHAHKKIA